MKKLTKSLALCGVAAVTAIGFSGSVAAASQITQATMQEFNQSGASGTAQIELHDDDSATFTVNMTGVTPSMPHAQHVHFGNAAQAPDGPVIPPESAADDANIDSTTTGNAGVTTANGQPVPAKAQINHDEHINTLEGQPFYGDVQISLTTGTADTTAASGLDVANMPAADASGEYNYERTIDLTADQVQAVEDGAVEIVVHGVDFWTADDPATNDANPATDTDVEGNSTTPDGTILSYTYDSNADGNPAVVAAEDVYPKSPLAAALGAGPLPLEATMPVAVGEFNAVPTGAVDTGLGQAATQTSYLLVAGGSALAVAAAGTGLYIRRRGEV